MSGFESESPSGLCCTNWSEYSNHLACCVFKSHSVLLYKHESESSVIRFRSYKQAKVAATVTHTRILTQIHTRTHIYTQTHIPTLTQHIGAHRHVRTTQREEGKERTNREEECRKHATAGGAAA